MTHNMRIKQPIRKRPAYQLQRALRDAGVTQTAIAAKIGVTPSFVSRVMARRATLRPTPTTEAIWREIERALGARA